MSIRSRRALLLPLATGGILAACGGAPTAGDYASAWSRTSSPRASTARPSRPASRSPIRSATTRRRRRRGTIFSCTAAGSDGTVYTFTVTIVGRNRMQLVSEPPLPAAAAGDDDADTAPTAPADHVGG